MKKLLIVLSALFLMSGCELNSTTDKLSCSTTTTANGITTRTTYNIDYKDDDVKYITISYDHNRDNTTDDQMDGVNADTDGTTNDNTNGNDTGINADDVVDGVVGDAIDETVRGVRETILDIAGIKNNYEAQLSAYDNIEGFTYKVDIDNTNEYKITYNIDMEKISDTDLAQFNVSRNLSDIRDNYEGLGYTCK